MTARLAIFALLLCLAPHAAADSIVEPFGTTSVCFYRPELTHTVGPGGNLQVFQSDCRLLLAGFNGTDTVVPSLPSGSIIRSVSVTIRDYCSAGCSHLAVFNAQGGSFQRDNLRPSGSAPEVLTITDTQFPGITSLKLSSLEAFFDNLTIVFDRPPCRADFNNSGGLSSLDIFDFLNAWLAASPIADFNNSGNLSSQDIFDFLNAWLAGC